MQTHNQDVPLGHWGELLLILVLMFTATKVNIGSKTCCIADIMRTCSPPASIHSNYPEHICDCADLYAVAADRQTQQCGTDLVQHCRGIGLSPAQPPQEPECATGQAEPPLPHTPFLQTTPSKGSGIVLAVLGMN